MLSWVTQAARRQRWQQQQSKSFPIKWGRLHTSHNHSQIRSWIGYAVKPVIMSENRPKTGFSPYSSDQTNHSHTENGILLCKLFFEREREAIRKMQNAKHRCRNAYGLGKITEYRNADGLGKITGHRRGSNKQIAQDINVRPYLLDATSSCTLFHMWLWQKWEKTKEEIAWRLRVCKATY